MLDSKRFEHNDRNIFIHFDVSYYLNKYSNLIKATELKARATGTGEWRRGAQSRGPRTAGQTALIHYLQYGYNLQCEICPKTTILKISNIHIEVYKIPFDWKTYLSKYPDLRNSGINTQYLALRHWLTLGFLENRSYINIKYNWKDWISKNSIINNRNLGFLIKVLKQQQHIFNNRYIKSYHVDVDSIPHIRLESMVPIYLIRDTRNDYIQTIKEYNDSIINYSKFHVEAIEHVDFISGNFKIKKGIIILSYDIVHNLITDPNSQRSDIWKNFLKFYKGVKILIVQDEYYHVNLINNLISEYKIKIVLTCSPNIESVNLLYSKVPADVQFINVLTGYTNRNNSFKLIKDKEIDIFYRGRKLHPQYGKLGYDKYEIGEKFKKYSNELKINISSKSNDRIYDGWLDILSKSKVTLGTPSGSNVIRYNDEYFNHFNQKYPQINSNLINDDASYPRETYEKLYKESNIKEILNFGQISPKMFEAISCGTVLVMLEGNYNGILKPNIHYIELKDDYSNIEDIIEKIKDDNYLQKIANQAYNDINEKYSYKSYVKFLDHLFLFNIYR